VELLKASFVAPKPIRTLRNLIRYRKVQIQDRSRKPAWLHKISRTPGSSWDASRPTSSASPAATSSTRSSHDGPAVLAELARGVLRKRIPALREALEGAR
jgi:transposase